MLSFVGIVECNTEEENYDTGNTKFIIDFMALCTVLKYYDNIEGILSVELFWWELLETFMMANDIDTRCAHDEAMQTSRNVVGQMLWSFDCGWICDRRIASEAVGSIKQVQEGGFHHV